MEEFCAVSTHGRCVQHFTDRSRRSIGAATGGPNRLPIATAAIDGKNVATLRWRDLCQAVELDPNQATADEVKDLLQEQYPEVQLCCPSDGLPYGLIRVHNVTLISSAAAPCIHQRTIPGAESENGAMPDLIDEVLRIYQRVKMVQMFTTDAGNTSLKVAQKLVERGYAYFMQFKAEHGNLYQEAYRVLGRLDETEADETYSDKRQRLRRHLPRLCPRPRRRRLAGLDPCPPVHPHPADGGKPPDRRSHDREPLLRFEQDPQGAGLP